ncbi:MFS transporter [Nonomuraea sp. PA05]|uniref:MFS transporter n=1 Tax=Nonomuraea sp. PA05 TaxID=2604466 RepID=UPI0011D9EC93|nr:MFS transporter [Nonomuraea sp. PA05]TYB62245.1 MFS transporter [Nonomuraea sp. PA05]
MKTLGRGGLAALLLLTSVELVVFLEVSIVNVALPALGAALAFTGTGLAWVVNAYQLTFGGFQLVAGRAADLLGRRRMFQLGIALFAVGSLVCGLAPDAITLLAGRAVQGVGAAIVVPAELAMLAAIFTEPAAYRWAFGVWSAMAAAGAGSGVALGGILTQTLGWPWIFLINVPIGLAALIASPRLLPADPPRPRSDRPRLDLLGALFGTGCLLALVFVASELPVRGWDGLILATTAITVALGALFAVNQRRHPQPILPRGLLAEREVRAGTVANALVGAAHVPAFVLLSLMLQEVMGYSAIAAGFAVLPIAVVNMVTARTLLPRAVGRYGTRTVLGAGMSLLGFALAGYALFLHAGAGFLTVVLPFSVAFAVGLPAVFVGSTASAVRAAPADQQGAASGLLNTAQRVGAALGLTGVLLAAAAWTGPEADIAGGLRVGFAIAAGLAALGTVCALVMFTRRGTDPAIATATAVQTQGADR